MKKDILKLPKVIGKNVKKLRVINELTIQQLSNSSNMTISAISEIENANSLPRPLNLRKLLLSMNYSLGLFISKIHDEAPHFNLDSKRLVSKKDDFLLLYGSRNKNSNRVLLVRPLENIDEKEVLELNILANEDLFKEKIEIKSSIWGILRQGELLIEFEKDEMWIKEGEEFQFDGKESHNYRSISNIDCVVTLIIETAMF